MIGDDSSDGQHKNHPVLADVTNQHGKRRFLSISKSPGLDRGNGFLDNVEGKVSDSEFVQKVCLGVENLVGGKYKHDCVEDGNAKGLSLAKPMELCSSLKSGNGHDPLNVDKVSGISSGVHSEIKECGVHFVRGNAATHRILERSDGLRDCCTSGVSELRCSEQCDKSGSSPSVIVGGGSQGDIKHVKVDVRGDAIGSTLENNVLDAHVCGDDSKLKDGGGDLISTKSNLAGSSSSKCSELEIGAGSGSADGSNANHGVDMLNGCSCSFCLKAAYILSDLHYQDVKGRVAALKKRREEVRFCVDRSLKQYETENNDMANLNKSKKLELDLMDRWKSLFLHTEDILIGESTQLQSSLLSLKELRESCKMELENTNGMPLNK